MSRALPCLENLELTLLPQFLPADAADALLAQLREQIAWRQDSIQLFGRRLPQPRLTAWYADPGVQYRYSGLSLPRQALTPALCDLQARLHRHCGRHFNGVLLNRYDHGQHSMGWHADDEAELGPEPVIASLSLGAERRFLLRRRDNHRQRLELPLPHGSLLLMRGPTQAHWQHALPKTRRLVGPRINLTWRQILTIA